MPTPPHRPERHRMGAAAVAVAALIAALAGAAAASLMALFFPPVKVHVNPADLPDPRPVVLPRSGTYTPFTAKPSRPPHPWNIYRVPGQNSDCTLSGLATGCPPPTRSDR